MSRILRLLIVALMFCALASAASAQTSTVLVGGTVTWYHTQGPYYWTYPNWNGTYIKLCTNPEGTQNCTQAYMNANYTWSMYVPMYRTYYVFSWNDSAHWGSKNSLANFTHPTGGSNLYTSFNVDYRNVTDIKVRSYPRPLPPQAVYPANGATGIPTNFTLTWTSGKDGYRDYQVVYDVYAYGDGAPELKVLSNVSCNPDGSGNCTYPITGQKSSARFNWRVVAKLNPGVATPSNPYYEQGSSQFNFTTATDPGAQYNFGTANLRNYLSATGCGGGDVHAIPRTAGSCESFQIIDLNGGDINHGDSVRIRIGAYYLSATNGGGSTLKANVTSGGSWETFTILKTSGSGRVLDGNRIAFRAANGQYVYSENGGGGAVWVSGGAIGAWEPFVFVPLP